MIIIYLPSKFNITFFLKECFKQVTPRFNDYGVLGHTFPVLVLLKSIGFMTITYAKRYERSSSEFLYCVILTYAQECRAFFLYHCHVLQPRWDSDCISLVELTANVLIQNSDTRIVKQIQLHLPTTVIYTAGLLKRSSFVFGNFCILKLI